MSVSNAERERRRPYAFVLETALEGTSAREALARAAADVKEAWAAPVLARYSPTELDVELEAAAESGDADVFTTRFSASRWEECIQKLTSGQVANLRLQIEVATERMVLSEVFGLAGPQLLIRVSISRDAPSHILVHVAHGLLPNPDSAQSEFVERAKAIATDIRAELGRLSADFLEVLIEGRAREPFQWAAFLGPAHLRALGGRSRVLRECPAKEMADLSTATHELLYIQATREITNVPHAQIDLAADRPPAHSGVAAIREFLSL